jgi:biofilm PGA synthesis N-glycosyltransferase PgaC
MAVVASRQITGGRDMSNSLQETCLAECSAGQTRPLCYVLITPARNESTFIELTIKSVVAQTVRPLKWVIVSDGSTDDTDEIVMRYAAEHEWIELVRMPERKERHFAGKVHAFNAGYQKVKGVKHDVVGSLDADISFEAGYFEFLLKKFAENPRLGVGGTPFREGETAYDYRYTSEEHVSGACQLFRRECFESIGGYVPLKVGGIDLAAVLTARMKGWQTRSFTQKCCEHHRKMGTANHSNLMIAFNGGYHDYLMGGHPVWQFFRSVYQMRRRPVVIGGCVLLTGYLWAAMTRAQKVVSEDLVKFRRSEQIQRLRKYLGERLSPHCR